MPCPVTALHRAHLRP